MSDHNTHYSTISHELDIDLFAPPSKQQISDLIINICNKWGVSPRAIKGPGRNSYVRKARWEIIKHLYEDLGVNPTNISILLNKNHSTVVYALKKMSTYVSTSP